MIIVAGGNGMDKKRKHRSIEIIVLMLTVVFLVEVIQVSVKQGFDIKIEDMKNYMESKVTAEIVETLSPNLMYSFEDALVQEYTMLESMILKQYPLLEYSMEACEYETAVENEGAYELILKGEANDENFVDENGNVVIVAETAKEEEKKDAQKEDEVKEETTTKPQEATGKKQEINMELLKDEEYVKSTYYTIDSTTYVEAGELSADKLLGKDMKIKGDNSKPQILIFHTHSQEAFADSVPGDVSTTIVGVGDYLAQLLTEKYNFNVIHNTTTYDLIDGKLDRNKAYSLAEPDIQAILTANPSIEVVLDIHRDAMDEQTHLVTEVNGKPTARFMFFNGMSRTKKLGNIDYLQNPYREDNMSFAFQMQLKAEEYYPGLTRRIYLKGYRYNLHLMPKTLLVEVGAQNNTVEEEKNAMEPLAHMLSMVLKGE
jgi:stage II sporulation protein P